jgi:photosystem II stability/assembly factor-like uncharacterized protein
MGCKRWFGFAAALLGVALVVAACGTVRTGATSGSKPRVHGTVPPPTGVPNTPPPPLPDRWLAYLTAVNPGSAIDFATARVGWRLDGQDGVPHLDKLLAAGPAGTSVTWPGSSVAKTTDGGKRWTSILHLRSGVWGMDLLSPSRGWVVGVTSLERTTDGGRTFQRAGEPSGHALVRVAFVSADVGFGLTTTGQLVRTSDAGSSWAPGTSPAAGGAMCFASPQVGYLADQSGNVFATADGGTTWQETERSSLASGSLAWSDLSCSGTGAWLNVAILDPAALRPPLPYLLAQTSDSGASWSVVSDSPAGRETALPAASRAPGDLGPVGFSAVSAGPSGEGVLVGLSPTAWQIRVVTTRGVGHGFSMATVPAVPARSPSPASVHSYIQPISVTFVGSTGWLYFDDTALGSASRVRWEPVIWRTTDGGSSWTELSAGPEQAPPPYGGNQ